MAKKQVATVEVFCNAKQAVQVLNEYKRLASDTLSKIEQKTQRVNAIRAKGTNATKAELAEMKKLTSELKKDEANFRMYNSAVQKGIDSHVKLRNVMRDLSGSKLKDLKYAMRELQKMMQNVSNDTPKRAQVIQNSMQKVQAQITKLTGETGKFGAKHSSVWQTARRNIMAYITVFGAFNAIKAKLQDVFNLSLKFSDQLADVRKVSGLEIEDINQLAVNLSKLDTRTSLSTLVGNLAYSGAKLGFGEYRIEGLESYVKAANQVNVALGEELGEEAMPALSKITENMGLIKEMGVEKAMLATGSAIFKLASTSTASAGPIVEFSKRLLSIGKNAGLTTDQILALGSAADSMMLMPEVASTALGKLVIAMQTNHNLIEESLHIEPGTISNLYQSGKMMEAMLLVFEKMKEKGGINALGGIFKDLGSDGQRLKATLVTMSEQLPMLQKHLATSRQAFEDATAVTAEYNIQQETAAGIMQRANNMWEKAFVNPNSVDMVKEMAKAWYDVSKELTTSEGYIGSMRFTLGLLAKAIQGIIKLAPALIIAGVIRFLIQLGFALGAAKIGTDGLAASWARLDKAMKANWISLVLGLVAQLGVYIYSLATSEDKTTDSTKKFNMSLSELEAQTGRADAEMRRLGNAILEAKKGTEARTAAINTFNNKFGQYLSNMLTEGATARDLAKAYDEVTAALRAKLALELKEKDIENEVQPREGWAVDKRQRYGQIVKDTEYSQYDTAWIAGYAKDTRGKSMNDIAKDLGKRYGLSPSQIADVMRQGGREKYERVENVGYSSAGPYGGVSRAENRATIGEQAFHAALRYIMQDRSAQNAMRRVNQKWKPEQDAIDAMLAKESENSLAPLTNEAPDKEAIKAANAEAREEKRRQKEMERQRKKELQDQLKQAEQESDAIIAKIEEWYRLQETFIEDAVADNKLTRDYADAYLRTLKMSKNQTLANARKSIAGKMNKEDWDKYIGPELERMMADQGEWSTELAGDIMKANLQAIYNLLARFNGSAEVMGLKSTASFDRIMKNAAGNEREIARERAKIKEEVDKILLEYHYVEQAERGFHSDLVGLGIMSETYEQYVNRMREEAKKAGTAQQQGEEGDFAWSLSLPSVGVTGKRPATPEEQLLKQFLSNGAKPYGVNIENDRELFVWLKNLMSNYDYDEEDNIMFSEADWVKGFPQLKQWVEDIDKYRPDIQKFYHSLIKWEDKYYNARKMTYEHHKKDQEDRFRASGETERYEAGLSFMETSKKIQDASGAGLNFGQQYGLEDAIANDPEIKLIQARMEMREKELEDAKAHGAAQELINERQKQLLEEFSNLTAKVSSEVAARVQKIQTLSEPLYSWGEEVGQMLGEQWRGISRDGKLSFAKMTKNMAIEYAKQTLKMASENLTKKLQQALFYKQMEGMEATHQTTMTAIQTAGGAAQVAAQGATNAALATTQNVHDQARVMKESQIASIMAMFGVSEGAAKTIAALGWWGIPLIGVITSILMGLLSSAKATANQSSSTSSAATKVKLTSGMLTYDEGNVQSYVGNDGHVYRASRQTVPQGTSLITSPIATTINGNPALVAERGPEIVIGRRTTRQIMMNEPGLLQHLAQLDRRHSVPRYRTYDDGNLSEYVALPTQPQSETQAERDEQMRQTLDTLTRTVAILHQRLQQPIKAEINKYGTGGLIDEVKSGLKFDQRYNR